VSIAKRVRECRYAKGWGPDELAGRAEVSRTALYQIECGKTGTPRASTLRRIAEALEVPIEVLLGTMSMPPLEAATTAAGGGQSDWRPDQERSARPFAAKDPAVVDAPAKEHEPVRRYRRATSREGDLQRKFRELLSSPLGEGLARIVEETHRLLPTYADE
jgi:transcriptional regulator with XRE-family HTH domain